MDTREVFLSEPSLDQPADRLKAGTKKISPYNVVVALTLIDIVAIVLASVLVERLVHAVRSEGFELGEGKTWTIVFAVSLQFLVAIVFRAYDVSRVFSLQHNLRRTILSHLATSAMMAMLAVAAKQAEHYSRIWFFSWALLSVLIACACRLFLERRVSRCIEAGNFVDCALSIGVRCEPIASDEIERQTERKVRVIKTKRLENDDALSSLANVIAEKQIDHVYVSVAWQAIPETARALRALRHLSAKIFVLPSDCAFDEEIVRAGPFGERISICVIEESIEGWGLWLKRAEDIVVALMALGVCLPLMAAVAVAVRLDSPGPIFFNQVRIGFNGRKLVVRKFRSMFVEQTDQAADVQTSKNDPRVTRVGRIIRRLSIDELPQLFNVLDGSMSIVGPRPHALSTKAEELHLAEAFDDYAVRHRVKPGITGLAQIHGCRGELDSLEKLRKRIDYDLEYIERWSLWLDIEIMLKTVLLIIRDKNAY